MYSRFCLLVVFFGSFSNALWGATPSIKALGLNSEKTTFFERVYEATLKENQRVATQRKQVIDAYHLWQTNKEQSDTTKENLEQILKEYKISKNALTMKKGWRGLLARVDEVPASLVLAQAANESAWGKSRFARLGNNLFGQWCYKKGCGIVPLKRPHFARYEVQTFASMDLAVRAYLNNLNTNRAYQLFRTLRQKARSEQQTPNGLNLAYGLINYSTRRHAYVKSIQIMIRRNHLDRLDKNQELMS